jgi:hypothetical protein
MLLERLKSIFKIKDPQRPFKYWNITDDNCSKKKFCFYIRDGYSEFCDDHMQHYNCDIVLKGLTEEKRKYIWDEIQKEITIRNDNQTEIERNFMLKYSKNKSFLMENLK